jgi:hypothetical protein
MQTTSSLDISRLANYLVDCSLAADDDAVEQTLKEIATACVQRLHRRGAAHRLQSLASLIETSLLSAERTGFEPEALRPADQETA